MELIKEINLLEYFNDNVDKLQGFNFWKNFPSDSGISITFDYSKEETEINSKILGPDDESISAFILKYRLFIQDKDDISLRNIEKLYSSLPIDKDYKARFYNFKSNINEILNGLSNVEIKQRKVTKKEIHDMFIYGVWAHLNKNDLNRKRFLAIKDNTVVYTIFANEFNILLIRVMNILVQIKFLNEEVIRMLKKKYL